MAKPETTSTRAPRGTKPVSQAFFAALDMLPEQSRAAVAKAAQAAIRDELKVRRDKMRVTVARDKEKARLALAPADAGAQMVSRKKPGPTARSGPIRVVAKAPAAIALPPDGAIPAKRRGRKPVDDTGVM